MSNELDEWKSLYNLFRGERRKKKIWLQSSDEMRNYCIIIRFTDFQLIKCNIFLSEATQQTCVFDVHVLHV